MFTVDPSMVELSMFTALCGRPWRTRRHKGGVPKAVVAALEAFPDDRRVRCEGVLTVQNLSLTRGGARAMTKAGVAPVIIRLLRNALEAKPTTADETGVDEEARKESGTADAEHLDRDGEKKRDQRRPMIDSDPSGSGRT